MRAHGRIRPPGLRRLRTYAFALTASVALVVGSGASAAYALADPLNGLGDVGLGNLGLVNEQGMPKLVLPFALPAAAGDSSDSSQAALKFVEATYRLAPAQAQDRLAAESASAETAQLLQGILGDELTGFWLDGATGDLVAGVDSDGAAQIAELAGARPHRMPASTADLFAAKGLLDQRAQSGELDGAGFWYVDQPGNQLIVAVIQELQDQIRKILAAALGDLQMVQLLHLPEPPRALSERLLGGQGIEILDDRVCSTAFNARDDQGRAVLLTAGHCTQGLKSVMYRGSRVGTVRTSVFPKDDFGVIRTNTGLWSPVGAVSGQDGKEHAVTGYATAPVGATVCKSGITSGWTCGTVTAHDTTVQYEEGELVYGLTQETACSLDGDSGGAVMAGDKAVGIVSGGQTMLGGCLALLGLENVSFYQPIGEVLDRLDLTLIKRR